MSERIIRFSEAWDKSDPEPSKNYGIRDMNIWFYLKGSLAVVQFSLGTRWYLPGNRSIFAGPPYEVPETRPEVIKRMNELAGLFGSKRTRTVALCDYYSAREANSPMGYDVGYHSPVALYEGQIERTDCEFFSDGKKCFYDGSSFRAYEWAEKFVAGGDDWLWPAMEEELRIIEERVKQAMEDEKRFS